MNFRWAFFVAAVVAALVLRGTVPAIAGSTINTTQPVQGLPYSAGPIRQNFNAAANDVNGLLSMHRGASAPSSPTTGQLWLQTPGSGTTYTLNVWLASASAWVPIARLNSASGAWMPPVGGGEIPSIVSAATTNLGSMPQATLTITGSQTISSFGSSVPEGQIRFLIFSGSPTLIYNSTSMILPTVANQNLTMAPGETAIAISLGSGRWRVGFTGNSRIFPVSILVADSTGATNVTPQVQAAVTAACLAPVPALFIPPGIYKFLSRVDVPTGCKLKLWGDPGNAILIADAANVDATAQIFLIADANQVEIHGLVFDGNVDGGNINDAEMIRVTAPTANFVFADSVVRNTFSSAIIILGESAISGVLSVDADPAQADLVFASVPAGVKKGAQVVSNLIDPNLYAITVTGTTVTLNKDLNDTVKAAKTVSFTDAFETSADAHYGDLTLSTIDTTGLEAGQTIYSNTTPQCIQSKTRIVSIAVNTLVTIDRKVICDIASGDLIAASKGNADVTFINNSFENIGQPQIHGSLAPVDYNTVGVQASGQPNLTLACTSGAGCDRAGVVPGQYTGATPPAGVPANTLVIGGPTSIDSPAGSYTITLAANLTGNVADATPIPFNVSRPGQGFSVWHSFGAWFANREPKFINNRFGHSWLAPLFLKNTGYVLLQGNSYVLDGMEFVDPNIAPSPCVNGGNVYHLQLIGENCKGASGNGVEVGHTIGLTVSGGQYTENGKSGIQIASGGNIAIGGGAIFRNNGQYKNRPFVQAIDDLGQVVAGIRIAGSQTFGLPGTMSNIAIDNVVVVDDQATPTQEWGVAYQNADSGFTNLRIGGNITGSGNISGLIDPSLKMTTPSLLTTSGNWTVPWAVCDYRVSGTGGGGAGGGVDAAAATAASGLAGIGATWAMTPTPGATMAYTIAAGGTPGAAGANPGGNGGDTIFDGVTLDGGTGGLGSAAGNAAAYNLNTANKFPGTLPTAAASIEALVRSLNIPGMGSGLGGNGVSALWSPRAVALADSAGTAATGYGGSGSGAGSTGIPGPFAGGAGAPGAIYIRPMCP